MITLPFEKGIFTFNTYDFESVIIVYIKGLFDITNIKVIYRLNVF